MDDNVISSLTLFVWNFIRTFGRERILYHCGTLGIMNSGLLLFDLS